MKVSVALLTYNHKNFIKECLESILSQETNFAFEVVVGDDCSNDSTTDIVLEYKKKYPEIIKILPRDKNLGMNNNFTRTIDACRGEYVAFIEGDDYWTDVDKLQMQSDFLDRNKEYSFCFHLVKKIEEKKEEILIPEEDKRRDLFLEDFLEKNFLGSSSIFFRRSLISNWPKWIRNSGMMDWPLYIILLKQGRAGFINRTMGVYRIHGGGINSSNSKINNLIDSIRLLRNIKKELNKKYKKRINFSIIRFRYNLAKERIRNKQIIRGILNFMYLALLPFYSNYFSEKLKSKYANNIKK